MEVAQTLYTERVIAKVTFDELERSGGSLANKPLEALRNIISKDPNKLKILGSILSKSRETEQVAKDILHEYSKYMYTMYHDYDNIHYVVN